MKNILKINLSAFVGLNKAFAQQRLPLEPDNFNQPHQSDLFQRMLDIEPTKQEHPDPLEYMAAVVEANYNLNPNQFLSIAQELNLKVNMLPYPITNNRKENPVAGTLYIVTDGKRLYVSDDCGDMTEAEQWLNNLYNIDNYVAWEKDITENIESVYYHGTPTENVESIMRDGLNPMNKTRGISNTGTGSAVFLTPRPEHGQSYGESIIEVNMSQWLSDLQASGQDLPEMSLEEPIQECEQFNLLAYKIGLEDYEKWCDSSDGIQDDTLIVYDTIPPQYLSIEDY